MPSLISPRTKILLASAALVVWPTTANAQMLGTDWSDLDEASAPAADADAPAKRERTRRAEVSPYLEAKQVFLADLDDGGDVLTYSTLAVGVNAGITERNAEAQVNVRYERLIGYSSRVRDRDNLSGLARGNARLGRNVSVEAGAYASRARTDNRAATPGTFLGNQDNVSHVYSVYTGPTFAAQLDDVSVASSLRAGYTKVDNGRAPALPTGQAAVPAFDDSVSYSAQASVAMQPGRLPVGWAVSAGWNREDASQLDQRVDEKYLRADVTVPVTPTLALVGGVGYENVEVSERDVLRDASGAPIRTADGRFVVDPASPRLNAYDSDGLIWDAGVLWRPSRRTSLEARYGHRYGSDTYYGSFSYAPSERMGVNVSVYDTISGFGGSLNRTLAGLPTQFNATRNPLSGDLGNCAFGTTGSACFGNALGSLRPVAFRSRGVSASMVTSAGGWDTGIAAGYNRQKYLSSALGALPELEGLVDQNYYIAGYLGRDLDRRSRFETNVYGNLLDPGFALAPDIYSIGANAAYYRQIWRGLSAGAAVGIDSVKPEDADGDVSASALLGLRYSF
ncbi:hypothetical protein ACFSAG_12400 [Sphingorhabdus buctiana]|uniref:Preprotein translocase subunit YajC n=1 Tax=Sphingorhabdus buctiana TaxID=1508805 RepID=A0ABW4MFS4_9SPHN